MTVGELIKSVRIEKGMTQKQVADACGMADSAIRKYESGKIIPKQETINRIARALGVSTLRFIDWDSVESAGPDDEEDPTIMEEILKDFPHQTEPIHLHFNKSAIRSAINAATRKDQLDAAFSQLNDEGQEKVVSYAQDLIPRYRATAAPQSPQTPAEDTDTTTPENTPETPPEGE